MKRKLLITGFDPFGGASINPAWEAVKLLPETIADFELYKLEIPTVYGLAAQKVLKKAAEVHPDVILCIGQAGGRAAVTPERIAVNIRDAKIPDNEGNRPVGQFVLEEGPAAYFATVDVMAMVRRAEEKGLPAVVSNSAGAFVCNDVLYTLLHRCKGSQTAVGFIHVPRIPEQGEPSLPVERTVETLQAMIEAC